MLAVHIGLGKTATTTLQKYIYPEIAKIKNISYNDTDLVFNIRRCALFGNAKNEYCEEIKENIKKINDDILISLESLVGWNPHYWEAAADRNLKMFGNEAIIIITVREPVEYLTSLYQQRVHQGNVKRPEDYFINGDVYSVLKEKLGENNLELFDVDSFDLRKLYEIYRERFEKVVFVPMDEIVNMIFLKRIYDLNDNDLFVLKKIYKESPRQNRAYSQLTMNLTFIRESMLNYFGFKTYGTDDKSILKIYRMYNDSKNSEKIISYFDRYTKKVLFVLWRKIMQNIVDKAIPYSKYKLPDYIDLNESLIEKNKVFLDEMKSK